MCNLFRYPGDQLFLRRVSVLEQQQDTPESERRLQFHLKSPVNTPLIS
jgi:hypothetical protein